MSSQSILNDWTSPPASAPSLVRDQHSTPQYNTSRMSASQPTPVDAPNVVCTRSTSITVLPAISSTSTTTTTTTTTTSASGSASSSLVCDPMEEFSEVEGHREFIQLIINAKAFADMNQTDVPVSWRGYNCLIEPNIPPFSKLELRRRLENAIKSISGESVTRVWKIKYVI